MEKPVKYGLSIQANKKSLLYIQDLTSLIYGISTGILQFESYAGFIIFLVSNVLTNLLFVVLSTKLKPSQYFENWFMNVFVDNLGRSLTGFLMAWTLAYALVQS